MKFWILILVLVSIGCNENEVVSVKDKTKESEQKPENDNLPENVILVVIDGPRWDHTFGDTLKQYIPNLWKLSEQGTLYANCFNLGKTFTNPGHVALTTGVYEDIDNLGNSIPRDPSFVHDYLKREKDSNRGWVNTSKDKLEILAKSCVNQFSPKILC